MIKYSPWLATFLVSLFCSQFAISETEVVQQVSGDKLVFEKVNGNEIATFNGKPYTGVRVYMDAMKGERAWKAYTNYKDGILDGEVIVWSEGKELYRFRYDKGKKILPETSGTK